LLEDIDMTSDELEDVLQQNLKLRRELVAEVAKANEAKRVSVWGVVYWAGVVLIPVLILSGAAFAFRYLGYITVSR
jgi:hypothetical protein